MLFTFKRFKIKAYYLWWKCCRWKEVSRRVWWHGGGSPPRGVPKCHVFWAIFRARCIPISRLSIPSLFSPHSLPLPFPLSISLLPFPTEVNKKSSYRGQNALSVIKSLLKTHERNTDSKHTVFIRTPCRLAGRIIFATCPSSLRSADRGHLDFARVKK